MLNMENVKFLYLIEPDPGGRALFKKLLKILNGSCPVQARKKEK